MARFHGVYSCAVAFAVAFSFHAAGKERSPVIFAHGVGVPAALYQSFSPLERVFRDFGYEVHVANTPTNGTLEERAEALGKEIRRWVPEGSFHLMGHSMGGLDARMAIQRYDLGKRCLSLTTLSTPHRGSPLANWVMDRYQGLNVDPSVENMLILLGGDIRSVKQLTTHYLQNEFNPVVLNDERIRYFSMGFYVPEPVFTHVTVPFLWIAHELMRSLGQPMNDGPVPTDSAVWGEYLGSFPGDHYSETAPVPFAGHMIYRQVFERALKNLDRVF